MAQRRRTSQKKSGLIIALLILIILAGAALLGATIFGILKQQELDRAAQPAITAEPTPAPTEMELYADKLTAYYQAISQRLDAEALREKDLNYMLSYSYGENAPARFGYLLTDLDGDGTEELLIERTQGQS